MQRLEVSGSVRPLCVSLGVKGLNDNMDVEKGNQSILGNQRVKGNLVFVQEVLQLTLVNVCSCLSLRSGLRRGGALRRSWLFVRHALCLLRG